MASQKVEIPNQKTIIVGRSSVGKSCILLRYLDNKYTVQTSTVAVDYRFKKVTAGGQTFTLEIWDTAGQERYRTIVNTYFNLSKAAIVVFDLESEVSFDDVGDWFEMVVAKCGIEIPKVLLGNKADKLAPLDLQQLLERLKPRIDKLKETYNCEFFAVSALTGENVNEAFQYLINKISQTIKCMPVDVKKKPLSLSDIKPKKQEKKQCCN